MEIHRAVSTVSQHLWYRELLYMLSQEKCKYQAIHKPFIYNGVLLIVYFHLFHSDSFLNSSLTSPSDSISIFALQHNEYSLFSL